MSVRATYICDACGAQEQGSTPSNGSVHDSFEPMGWQRLTFQRAPSGLHALWHACFKTACLAAVLRKAADEVEEAQAKFVAEMHGIGISSHPRLR